MKQIILPPSEIREVSVVDAFLTCIRENLGVTLPDWVVDAYLGCGKQGRVIGIGGYSACSCKHVQYQAFGCDVKGCPNCVERATRSLAQYCFWRIANVFELARSMIAVDFDTFTVDSSLWLVVARNSDLFMEVCVASLNEYYGVGENEELFVSGAVQNWGDEDISGDEKPHAHFLVLPFVFDKKTHLIVRTLSYVGKFINKKDLFRIFNKPLLAIFNRRMRVAFHLSGDAVVSMDINRRYACEAESGLEIASARLFHQIKYIYRYPISDVMKAFVNRDLLLADGEIYVRANGKTRLVPFDETRKARLRYLLSYSGLNADNYSIATSKLKVTRLERVKHFGAASKRKVGLVLKALQAYSFETNTFRDCHKNFVYKTYSRWHREHVSSCYFHLHSLALGVAEVMSDREAIRKFGNRILFRVNVFQKKPFIELESFDRS